MILEKLKEFINIQNLQNSKIAVACSGGIDSMVLLDAMTKLHPKELLAVLHLNHGWYKESSSALDLVKNFCDERSIRFYSKTYSTDEMKKTEKEARDLRYAFFEETARVYSLDAIFLAHNLNDNVETILFRLFRGTGLYGLQGIPSIRELESIIICRPLLDITRDVIEIYSEDNKIDFYEDPSNSNIDFSRNRIRHEVISQALKVNKNALLNIHQLARLVEEEQSFITKETSKALDSLGEMPWSLEEFRKLERVIQRKILELSFCPNISFVNDFLEAIRKGGFHRINFEKGHFFAIKQKEICLEVTGDR